MRKVLTILLAITVMLSSLSIGVFSADDTVFFESFESGVDNWSFATKAATDDNSFISKDKASDGKSAAYIIDDSSESAFGFKSNKIPVKPGETYTLYADIFNVEGTGAKVFFTYVDSSGTRLFNKSFYSNKTGVWDTMSLSQTAPEGTDGIVIILTGASTSVGKTYVDNIKVVKDGEANPAEKPVEKPEEVQTPSTKEGEVAYSFSFENGIDDWSNYSSKSPATYEVSTKDAIDGKKSARIWDETTEFSCGIRSTYLPIKAFNKYTLSGDIKAVEGTIKLYLRLYDKDKKQLLQKSVSANKKDWSNYSITLETNYSSAYAQIIVMTESSGVGEFYVDNLTITDIGAGAVDMVSGPVQDEINEKLKNAKPGDIIEIPDGTYSGVAINVPCSGNEQNPITLKAKNAGKVVLKGSSSLVVTGSYVHISGLKFEECSSEQIIRFEPDTRYCVLKDCAILNSNPVDSNGKIDRKTTQKWVYIQGKYNKVTNCYFRGKDSVGQMVEIIRKTAEADYHIVENCYFGEFKLNSGNGYETFRIGTSQQSLSGSYSTLQGCFFEKCNGEGEAISIKSCNNYILNNTLYNTQGAIVLRHGNENLVEGNLVIGGDKTSRPTGVRVIGEKHKVLNNYFYNLPETSTAVYIMDTNPNPLIHEYLEVKDIDVSNNTFINVDTALMLGQRIPSDINSSNQVIPPHGTVSNNLAISFKGHLGLIPNKEPDRRLTLSNNVAFGKDLGYEGELPEGLEYKEFDYNVVDGYLVAENLGADINKVKNTPKSPYDVMPDWIKKEYYDTGIYKFTPVKGDPFNTDLTVDKLLYKKGQINVTINGYRKEFDVEPQLINERTMVPLRAIFEEFGAEVSWDEATATAVAKTATTEIKITENSDISYVNGKEMKLDSPAVIIDGRFLVPLRFISESYGAKVGWIDAAQTATISFESKKQYEDFTSTHGIANTLPIHSAIASGDDGTNSIGNVIDGSLSSKWAVRDNIETGELGYGIFDLGSVKTLEKIYIAFQSHLTRIYTYEIYVSEDGINYTLAVGKTSTKNFDGEFENHDLKGVKARYVKYVGHGNNENIWNNPSEIVITGK